MCGRYKLSAVHKDVLKHFDLIDGKFDHEPNEEIFPGEEILAVNSSRRAKKIFWTIEDCDNSGKLQRAINAKSETLTKVDMFRDAFKNGRVLIPATGFYEWKDMPNRKKARYEFTFDEPLFAFAGVSRECEIKGETKDCGVILNRMPVILHKYDYEKWLDPDTSLEELRRMMKPIPNDEIRTKEVDEPIKEGLLPLFDE